jgi:hypothetical protein
MKARSVLCAAIVLSFALWLPAQAGAEGVEFTLNGVRFNGALLGFLPVPVGADVEFRVPVAADKLLFTLRLAGGYEDRLILRNDVDGSVLAKQPAFDASDQAHWFNWPNAEIDSGLLYRLLPGGEGPKVELFGLARGRYEDNSPTLSTAYFPDADGLLTLSFMGGAGVDAVRTAPSRQKSGYGGEISFEYGPKALAFSGGTDFYRASAYAEGYLPLFSKGSSDLNAVSAYAAAYLAGDYAGGSDIPLYVLTSFGGRLLRDGLGDSIRGYQSWGYEATTKAEVSFDLRFVGPALFGVASIRPIAYLFGDAGYFDGLYKCPSVADKNGLLFSAGAGAALDILDFAYVGVRAGYKFPVDDPLYSTYTTDGKRFFWNVTFLLHF